MVEKNKKEVERVGGALGPVLIALDWPRMWEWE